MGGVQSGTHNLGEALWMHERQRQRCHREESRYESQKSGQSTQDRRKLLKRTRSLAVISEDESRREREGRHFQLGDQTSFDLPRRHQLIPRAKLIDRNSLKDRLSKSHQQLSTDSHYSDARFWQSQSSCGLHSTSSLDFPLLSNSNPSNLRGQVRSDPDRLNILDWPDPPRRYRSVQALDTVSGLVDIVEENWPIQNNRGIDCVYTQVKRKRKEHRSLDSILFEDDGELEYFDVLNLLPLSNVRLEFDEQDVDNNKLPQYKQEIEYLGVSNDSPISTTFSSSSTRNNFEKTEIEEDWDTLNEINREEPITNIFSKHVDSRDNSQTEEIRHNLENEESENGQELSLKFVTPDDYVISSEGNKEQGTDENLGITEDDSTIIESLWISDTEDQVDMSRRPQVLKIVDNDVTKKINRGSFTVQVDVEHVPESLDIGSDDQFNEITKTIIDENPQSANIESEKDSIEPKDEGFTNVQMARDFFETKIPTEHQIEGRFERIVKETSNMIEKACNIVKGSLGYETTSDSSDPGLGSESGSETRRRSMDDGIEEDRTMKSLEEKNHQKHHYGHLTRSKSCMESIECQNNGSPEFDHVRYKIVKSNMFGKSMFTNASKNSVTYDGLMEYLREYSFQDLLLDNNVVIIEPVRAEVERKTSSVSASSGRSKCRIAGTVQKNLHAGAKETKKSDNNNINRSKQSSIRKHFFYQPIRVNRELIDEELPDPDTVRNVREMFENTLKTRSDTNLDVSTECKAKTSLSMKDLSSLDDPQFEDVSQKSSNNLRLSSRAKDLTKLFESLEKSRISSTIVNKDEPESPRSESKTRILAQTFEARSGDSSPSDSNTSLKNKIPRYSNHQNWDSGSVSSGVSSEYPDTDPGSGVQCISSEEEEDPVLRHNVPGIDQNGAGHYVSQDILKKIREYGTSVTYYGGKIVNTFNGPLISPFIGNRIKRSLNKDRQFNDYVKFRLVKSNSCDSRLELTGKLVERPLKYQRFNHGPRDTRNLSDLRQCTIDESPSIEITSIEDMEKGQAKLDLKREPPVVIGLEPKKDDANKEIIIKNHIKGDFKLNEQDDSTRSMYANRYYSSALSRWQLNENHWKINNDFGKMEFEEFEVLEDSLNGIDHSHQRVETSP